MKPTAKKILISLLFLASCLVIAETNDISQLTSNVRNASLQLSETNSKKADRVAAGYESIAISTETYNQLENELKTRYKRHLYFWAPLFLGTISTLTVFLLVMLRKADIRKKTIQEKTKEHQKEKAALMSEISFLQKKMAEREKISLLGIQTASIAHELNNGLNFIYAGSQALQDSTHHLSSAEVDHFQLNEIALTIKSGVEKCLQIIQGVKLLASPQISEFVKTDLRVCINSSLTILKGKITDNKIRVSTSYSGNSIITGNPAMLCQVFINFFDNAIDSMTNCKDPQLDISLEGSNKEVIVTIGDRGQGIPAEIKDKIYEPFFTTKPMGQGTGLGLYISVKILKKHNGFVLASSSPSGTKFTISFPCQSIL